MREDGKPKIVVGAETNMKQNHNGWKTKLRGGMKSTLEQKENCWKNNIQIMNAWTYAAYLKDLFITSRNQRKQNENENRKNSHKLNIYITLFLR